MKYPSPNKRMEKVLMSEEYLTLQETLKTLGVSKFILDKMIENGEIVANKVERPTVWIEYQVNKESVRVYLEKKQKEIDSIIKKLD